MPTCTPHLHTFPEGEDASKHRFNKHCPCGVAVVRGAEEILEDEDLSSDADELRDIILFKHNRLQ